MRNTLKTTEEFVIDARKVHGQKYDYSFVDYKNAKVHVEIICPLHGSFHQAPTSHLSGSSCKKCGLHSTHKNITINRLLKKFDGINQPSNYKIIPTTKGRFVKVDNDHFELVKGINWSISANNYAHNSKSGFMHRLITKCPPDMVVDHINHDTLDNRYMNLRVCTRQQNQMNIVSKTGKSKYKGVYWDGRGCKWIASINFKGKSTYIASSKNEIEMAIAYDNKAKELFGEFSSLNFA